MKSKKITTKVNYRKNEKGITLIALIITIIILVILVAVSIRAVANMKIVGHAINGTQDYARQAKAENKILEETENTIDSTLARINEIQGENGGNNGGETPANPQEPETQEVESGARASVKSTYTSGTGANAKTAVIPAGFVVSGKDTESNIATGLVIYRIPSTGTDGLTDEQIANINWSTLKTADNVDLTKTYDQFVWIPIPRANINDMFMCQGKTSSTICDIHLDENTGLPYCANHSNNTNMAGRLYGNNGSGECYTPNQTNQTYSANSSSREPSKVTNANDGNGTSYDAELSGTPAKYTNLNTITTILTGNLETGESYENPSDFLTTLQNEYNAIVKSVYENEGFWVGRYETSGLNGIVKVVAGTKTGIASQTWYTMYGRQKLYAKNQNLLGGMIQGAAYDQVMKFVNGDSAFNVTSTTQVDHNLSNAYNTGSKSGDKGHNIYDLAGNVMEWTTEAFAYDSRVCRGGCYFSDDTASARVYGPPVLSVDYVGTRFTLYVK